MATILIIDDDKIVRDAIGAIARTLGHASLAAGTLKEARRQARSQPPDLVFLDVNLPDGNGLEAFGDFRDLDSQPEVIIITGDGDAAGAQTAIDSGAWDYIPKPVRGDQVMLQVQRALEYHEKKTAAPAVIALRRDAIVGGSPALEACLDRVAQSAVSNANILITGETGTGKELFAEAIHKNSRRAAAPFVVVDCTALPGQLIESLLFGHVKGAFTGADRERVGLIEEADGGTLFLDEVGELPPAVQKNFLRVLQERRFRPLGGNREKKSDFRLISATNRDLDRMVAAGGFRGDLLFRLRTFDIRLPPLRERTGDIEALTRHYVKKICQRQGIEPKGVDREVYEILERYHWPGNVRQLVSTLEMAAIADPLGPRIYPVSLPAELRLNSIQSTLEPRPEPAPRRPLEFHPGPVLPVDDAGSEGDAFPDLQDYRKKAVEQAEAFYLRTLMDRTGFDISRACKISELSRSRLYALLKRYAIDYKGP